jgi:hypothetical protein
MKGMETQFSDPLCKTKYSTIFPILHNIGYELHGGQCLTSSSGVGPQKYFVCQSELWRITGGILGISIT